MTKPAPVTELATLCAGWWPSGAGAISIAAVRDDSRAVTPGDLFVAVPGNRADARAYIPDALARGAVAVVFQSGDQGGPDDAGCAARVRGAGALPIPVPDARAALSLIAARHFAAAGALTLTAVTGTNGKTTTTYLVEAMLAGAGRTVGVLGTIAYRYPGAHIEAPLTTPGALALHGLFASMRGAGCTDVVLEASSHALHQDRLSGCRFAAALLTNVTQDHLDYHRTMDAYFDAKAILFSSLLADRGVAVLRADRDDGRRMMQRVRGRSLTVSADARVTADVVARDVALSSQGIAATIDSPVGAIALRSALVGDYNLDNLLGAVGLGVAHDLRADDIAAGLAQVDGVPGRLQTVRNASGVLAVVDYAHTPDALERALGALRRVATGGRLLVVFGCGGDRDPGKRPIMGGAAVRLADAVIVTSDNPRSEDPASIIAAIVTGAERDGGVARQVAALGAGANGYWVQPDRRAAIRAAVAMARAGDVLLVAGKGHEDYQILATGKIHFDDREELAAAFAECESTGEPGRPERTP